MRNKVLKLTIALFLISASLFSLEQKLNYRFFKNPTRANINSFTENHNTKKKFLYLYDSDKEAFIASELKQTIDKTKKVALVIYPSADHNNAFVHEKCKKTYGKAQKDFNLFLARPTSINQLKNAIYDFNRMYGPIDCLWIQGHGKKNSLNLNKGEKFNFKSLTPYYLAMLQKDAKIFLDSCYTGMKGGLAQNLSAVAEGRKIYAATEKSYCRLVDFVKGEIQFKNLKNKNITVCYQNGINV